MMQEIHTAVLHEEMEDLEEPLIAAPSKDVQKNPEKADQKSKALSRYFRCVGFLFGFLLQVISLGSTSLLAVQFGDEFVLQTSKDKVFYYTLLGLSNSWLILFPVICIAVERSWTERGNQYLNEKLLVILGGHRQPKRILFLIGVEFLVGIVLGSFSTWGAIDLIIGTSTVMLMTLVASMVVCVALCYALILVFDSCNNNEEDEDVSPVV